MQISSAIKTGELRPVALLAFLLFINTLVLESNEVIATSGFVANVGVDQILIVWASVMLLAMLTSSAYALVVDRVNRVRLAVGLFWGSSMVYLGFYFMFSAGVPDYVTYGLLAVVNEQQWTLLPLVIWALANDLFPIAASKRLFPLLAAVVIIGGAVGNALAAAIGHWASMSSYVLLLFNSILLCTGGMTLFLAQPRLGTTAQRDETPVAMLVVLREGFEFVANVPAYRLLAIIMVLMGLCLNTLQYQFLVDVAAAYPRIEQLQLFYGAYKIIMVPLLLLLQSRVATWLLSQLGFKGIFTGMPVTAFLGLLLTLAWVSPTGGAIALTGAIVGNFLFLLTLNGVDKPARLAFQGLVPDQRRGRVSALMEGFLYPTGSVLGCFMIGAVIMPVHWGWLDPAFGRFAYVGITLLAAAAALWFAWRFLQVYDQSMLNWRLKRRQHRQSVLDQLNF